MNCKHLKEFLFTNVFVVVVFLFVCFFGWLFVCLFMLKQTLYIRLY